MAEISIQKNHRYGKWQFVKHQTAVRTEPKMYKMKLSRRMADPEKKFQIVVLKGALTIGYYCLYVVLYGPNLMTPTSI